MATDVAGTTSTGTSSATPEVNGILWLVKILPGHVDALREMMKSSPEALTSPTSNLARTEKVHFARFAIIGEYLLFGSYFDGTTLDYLDDFYMLHQAEDFDAWQKHLEGWPGPHNREAFVNWWTSHQIEEIRYSAYPGVTVKGVHKALRIQRNLEAVLEDFQ